MSRKDSGEADAEKDGQGMPETVVLHSQSCFVVLQESSDNTGAALEKPVNTPTSTDNTSCVSNSDKIVDELSINMRNENLTSDSSRKFPPRLKETGERKSLYLCSICGMVCKTSTKLNIHMRVHTDEKSYVCSFCGKRSASQASHDNHIRIHSGEKLFKCSFCDKTFLTSTRLKRHEKTHSGEKPYDCFVCGKLFTVKCSIKKHLTLHTGAKLFQCESCDKSFPVRGELKSHMKTHIKKKEMCLH